MGIHLPVEITHFPHLETTPAGIGQIGIDFRTVAVDLQDVAAWAQRGAAPADWSGDAAEAAHHARTVFARRVAVAATALRLAATASAVLEDRLVHLVARRRDIEMARIDLNHGIEQFYQELALNGPDDPDLQRVARELSHRADAVRRDIAAWVEAVTDAEAAYVDTLRRIDTTAGATKVAGTLRAPDPDALLHHLRSLGGAAAVAAWWRTLSPGQQEALTTAYPGAVGSTGGVPVVSRDRANRAHLEALRGVLTALPLLTGPQRAALRNLHALQQQIGDHRHDVDPITGRHLLNVISFDPYAYGGDGSAVVSLGDPDVADQVSTYTPGFSAHGGRLDGIGEVDTLYDDVEQRFGGRASVATILWDGYDNPSWDGGSFGEHVADAGEVVSPGLAQAAGHHLAGFLDGLDATHHGGDAQVTVIGHSYGSTVAAYAAHGQPPADSVVLLANPGVPGHSVHDLVGDSGIRVFVGSDDHDAVSLLGHGPEGGPATLGDDPAAASYGATRFTVPTGPAELDSLLDNHSAAKYLSGDGLRNVTTIELGGDPTVAAGRTAGSYQSVFELLNHAAVDRHPILVGGGEQLLKLAPLRSEAQLLWDLTPDGTKHDLLVGTLDALKGMLS